MPVRRTFFLPMLWVAFAAVVLSFVATTALADRNSAAIDDDAQIIARKAAPSVLHLERARAEMRRLQQMAAAFVEDAAAGRKADADELAAQQRKVDDEVEAYLVLSTFAEERELSARIRATMRGFEHAVGSVQVLVAAHDSAGAAAAIRGNLRTKATAASEALLSTVELNAAKARELALRIEHVREQTRKLTIALEAVCALLAALLAVGVGLVSHRYTALLEEHNVVVEQRAAELEMFASRVAHDILNPLAPVALAVEMTLATLDEDARPREWLLRAKSSVQRVKGIVDGLLEFARAGAMPRPDARATLAAVLEDVAAGIRPQAERVGIDLVVEGSPATGADLVVACSPELLSTALANLVQNAIKFMGEAPERRVSLRTQPVGAGVKVWVEDTGPGLMPHLESTIFEPYVRGPGVKQPGIGLGLATVKRIVVAHGGSVGVSSSPGKGCRFWIELPRAPSDL